MLQDTRKIKKDKNSQEFTIAVDIPETMEELKNLFPSLDESTIIRNAFESIHIDRAAAVRKSMTEESTTEHVQQLINNWTPGLASRVKKADLISYGKKLMQEVLTLAHNTNSPELFPVIFEIAEKIDSKQTIENVQWAMVELKKHQLELEKMTD